MEKNGLLSRVLKSVFYKTAGGRATRMVRNSGSIVKLIQDAMHKSGGLSGASFAAVRSQVGLLARLLKAYTSGQYRQIPWKSMLSIVTVLVYFVNPLDFLPDLLPVVGFADDIALLVWLFNSLKGDLEKFEEWESSKTVKEVIPIG